MENSILKQIINQVQKYKLTDAFGGIEEFKEWASKLNSTQINNFLGLDIDLEELRT